MSAFLVGFGAFSTMLGLVGFALAIAAEAKRRTRSTDDPAKVEKDREYVGAIGAAGLILLIGGFALVCATLVGRSL